MDGLFATLLLLGAGFCVVGALAAAKRLRIDAWMERAAGFPSWHPLGKGFAMAGWMMLAAVGVVTLGVVPATWLTTPAGATWFALAFFGALAVIAWTRSMTQVRSAHIAKTSVNAAQNALRKAA